MSGFFGGLLIAVGMVLSAEIIGQSILRAARELKRR